MLPAALPPHALGSSSRNRGWKPDQGINALHPFSQLNVVQFRLFLLKGDPPAEVDGTCRLRTTEANHDAESPGARGGKSP